MQQILDGLFGIAVASLIGGGWGVFTAQAALLRHVPDEHWVRLPRFLRWLYRVGAPKERARKSAQKRFYRYEVENFLCLTVAWLLPIEGVIWYADDAVYSQQLNLQFTFILPHLIAYGSVVVLMEWWLIKRWWSSASATST